LIIINKIILCGNTTKDLEIRTTGDNKEVATGSIAVSRTFKNKEGNYDSDFFNFVIWNPTDYVKGIIKGTKVLLDGEIRNETYENDKKEKKTITRIYVNHIEAFKKQEKQEQAEVPQNVKTEYDTMGSDVKLEDEDIGKVFNQQMELPF
jgi:single-strand DNA-binding protein